MASYIGFKGLVGKLEKKGKSAGQAKGIAAAVGRKKYGKTRFQKAAKTGTKLC